MAAAAAVGVLVGLSATGGSDDTDQPAVVDSEMSLAYPMETARDWVSYGDHVAVVHVREGSERAEPLSARDRARGEAHLSRTGTLVVDEVLYSREGAESLPRSFTTRFLSDYWWDGDSGRQELNYRGTSRVEPSHSYVAVLVRDEETGRFEPVAAGGVLPYDDGVVGRGEVHGEPVEGVRADGGLSGMARSVNGEDARAVAETLRETTPYPAAAAHPDLSAEERFRKVSAAEED